MIESLRTTQIAFFRFATLCGFFRGSADEVQKVSVQGFVQEKLIWNHLWEHRFSVPDPRVFPPPGGRFSPQTTESPFYDWAHRQPSNNHVHGFVSMRIPRFARQKQEDLWQNKVTASLAFIQWPGHWAHNCKTAYSSAKRDNSVRCILLRQLASRAKQQHLGKFTGHEHF